MEITRNGCNFSGTGPSDWFTVTARLDPLVRAPDPARVTAGSVTVEPVPGPRDTRALSA
jgi:hypothetical protein